MEDMVMDVHFWKGRQVLLTGHTGFKGGMLGLWLAALGAKVTGLALEPPTDPSLFKLARVGTAVRSILGDIRNADGVKHTMRETCPEIVFHMAAQPLVRQSYRQPVETYSTNVMGTVNVLEAVRHVSSVRACVVVTSDKCYENREWLWGYRENEPLGGVDPYSSSKACAEIVAAAYRHSYFHPTRWAEHRTGLATARAGNVIGGGDFAPDRLVPDLVRAFVAGQPALIRRPQAIRPWQHVLDPLAGYILLAQRLCTDGAAFAQAWNFGPTAEDGCSVLVLAKMVADQWGKDATIVVDSGSSTEHEAHELRLDSSRARSLLGWQPRWDIQRAVQETVIWHQALREDADMYEFTLRQIREYQAILVPGGASYEQA